MIFALAKFSGLIKAFNRRPLTERDFIKGCQSLGITIGWANMPVLRGFHTNINGQITIFLDRKLKGPELLFVAFHELAHAVLHESRDPVSVNFFNQSESDQEEEADAVALLALIPTKHARHLRPEDAEHPFWGMVSEKRVSLFRRIGL